MIYNTILPHLGFDSNREELMSILSDIVICKGNIYRFFELMQSEDLDIAK